MVQYSFCSVSNGSKMSKFDSLVELSENMDKAVISALGEFYEMCKKEKFSLVEAIEQDIVRYKQTGVLVFTGTTSAESTEPVPEHSQGRNKQKANTTMQHRSSSKENQPSNGNDASGPGLNSQTANQKTNMTIKLERLSKDFMDNYPDIENVRIEDLKIKQELISMPPPSRPPLKQPQRRKNTRNIVKASFTPIQVKGERCSTSTSSDVQISLNQLSIVSFTETNSEEEEVAKAGCRTRTKRKYNGNDISEDDSCANVTLVTHTKTCKAAKNHTDSDQETMEGQALSKLARTFSKKTKIKAEKNKQNEESSILAYEDAVSVMEKTRNGNSTVVQDIEVDSTIRHYRQNESVVEKPTLPLNETIILNKEVTMNNSIVADLLTEDEDDIVKAINATEPKLKTMKQIFSPFASSPVKTQVEAFEAHSNRTLRMVTRTQTKTKKECTSNTSVAPLVDGTSSKHGAIPKLRSTSKIASSERGQRKEVEAQTKKVAMLQALAEERRRKCQERQLKAQQTRAAIEQEKQKVLASIESAKQEKAKQIIAEEEKKMLKLKEAASEWGGAMKKSNEEKREEKCIQQEHPPKPLYLKYEAPLLPTEDCYDSDDSNLSTTCQLREWEKQKPLFTSLMCMQYAKQLMPFHVTPTTVDLRVIFPSIEEKRLKRTSSAIWDKTIDINKLDAIGEEE